MKFDCGPSYADRVANRKKWHDWFAWHPVRLRSVVDQKSSWPDFIESRDCRWLETIERRGFQVPSGPYGMSEWLYEYRNKESKP